MEEDLLSYSYEQLQEEGLLSRLENERNIQNINKGDWRARTVVKDKHGNEVDPNHEIPPEDFPITLVLKAMSQIQDLYEMRFPIPDTEWNHTYWEEAIQEEFIKSTHRIAIVRIDWEVSAVDRDGAQVTRNVVVVRTQEHIMMDLYQNGISVLAKPMTQFDNYR
jgi:hypothetical protein